MQDEVWEGKPHCRVPPFPPDIGTKSKSGCPDSVSTQGMHECAHALATFWILYQMNDVEVSLDLKSSRDEINILLGSNKEINQSREFWA